MDIGYMLKIVASVIMLTLFIAIIYQAFDSMLEPNEQVVLSSTEILRVGINQVCSTKGSVELSKLSFPDSSPPKILGSTVLPQVLISQFADPEFLLYYEAFPPGEAIGWETYIKDLDYRSISPIYLGRAAEVGVKKIDFFSEAKKHKQTILDKIDEAIVSTDTTSSSEGKKVFVPNVILSDYLNTNPIEEPHPPVEFGKMGGDVGNLGRWADQRYYIFTGINNMPVEEQSMIKYRSCGENTLCLKTREGVYKFPLSDKCEDVEYIQLEYDARENLNKITIGGLAITLGAIADFRFFGGAISKGTMKIGWKAIKSFTGFAGIGTTGLTATALGGVALTYYYREAAAYKESDFYISGPCKLEGDIEIEYSTCNGLLKYPVYEYSYQDVDNQNLKQVGFHYTNSFNFDERNNMETVDDVPCLKIKINSKKKEFCWTPNPKVWHDDDPFWSKAADGITSWFQDWYTAFASHIGGLPVTDTTTYFSIEDRHNIVLAPFEVSKGLWNKIKSVFVEEGLIWGWPGGLFSG